MKTAIYLMMLFSFAGLYPKKIKTDAPAMAVDVSPDSLRAHVEALTSVMPPRNCYNPASLEQSVRYIERTLAAAGLAPDRQTFSAEGSQYSNVIATVNPEKGRVLVIGAHYDACGETPGADDNSSGVAGLLELARLLYRYRASLDCQVILAAYVNEEPPHFATEQMGSWVHAGSLRDSSADVRLMIALEMIGFFTEEKNSQQYPTSLLKPFYPSRGNFIAVVSDFSGRRFLGPIRKALSRHIPCRTLAGPRKLPGLAFSDHRSFWKAGFKAVMITDTAFFRNPSYHEVTDTPETLDYDKMASVVAGLAEYVLSNPI